MYVRYELSPNYVPLSPLRLKVGGHVPQLLWERRPCLILCVIVKSPVNNMLAMEVSTEVLAV